MDIVGGHMQPTTPQVQSPETKETFLSSTINLQDLSFLHAGPMWSLLNVFLNILFYCHKL